MVLKEECIVILDVRLKRVGNFHSGGCSVLTGGNNTEGKNCLGKNVLVKVNACNCECSSNRGMSVNDSVNVGTLLIYTHVHLDFGGGVELAFKLVTVLVYLNNHIGGKCALGYAGRSAVILVVAYLDRDITVVCCDKAKLVYRMTDFADFFFDFVGRFHFFVFLSNVFYFFVF